MTQPPLCAECVAVMQPVRRHGRPCTEVRHAGPGGGAGGARRRGRPAQRLQAVEAAAQTAAVRQTLTHTGAGQSRCNRRHRTRQAGAAPLTEHTATERAAGSWAGSDRLKSCLRTYVM